ncbi:MAG: tRNA lysidine(34) synthetase TilS, partial [Vicinamibacterales bacterium]
MTLIDRVRRTLQRQQLTRATTRVVAALSGGPDSMALLHVLRALDAAGELQLVAAAHLNHCLREAADADERFCAGVAAALGLPFVVERIDVAAFAAAGHRSVEDAAHLARHAFFERAAQQQAAGVVAVGHTQDDQAETFLLRLVRGAGARGLSAMHPRNGIVIRPMLECSKAEARAFLREQAVAFVHDASNDDVGIPRNRVRAELLPLLVERFNPRMVEVLAAEAELARADEQLLDAMAATWRSEHLSHQDDGRRMEAAALAALPQAVAWRVLYGAMREAASGRLVGFHHVKQAWEVVVGSGSAFDAPGQRVERTGAYVVLSSGPAGSAGRPSGAGTGPVAAFRYTLPVPGEVTIAEAGCVMSALLDSSGGVAPRADDVSAVVPLKMVAGGLAVRNRRPGDRLQPSPAGHRKLQDLFVDRKVPREARDRIPIVVDAADRIVWVPGHALDREFHVTDPLQAVVI